MNDQIFNVAQINLCTRAEGPYRRLAIWFQGCLLQCPGCCNPELIDMEKKHIISLEKLIDITQKAKVDHHIEGVTYLGGEPTLQHYLPELTRRIHQMDLGIILFTGYAITQLSDDMIKHIDLLVDGPYLKDKPDHERNMSGSTNQSIHYLTDRYQCQSAWFYKPKQTREEINVKADHIFWNGFE